MADMPGQARTLDPDGPAGGLFPKGSDGERELAQARRDLVDFDRLTGLADRISDKDAADLVYDSAWRLVDESGPVRVEIGGLILEVQPELVTRLLEEGVLDRSGKDDPRVTLASVLETRAVIDEVRELGADADLVAAAISKLEMEALQEDDRFIRSLEQMRRGERGEWPERYRM